MLPVPWCKVPVASTDDIRDLVEQSSDFHISKTVNRLLRKFNAMEMLKIA